MKTIESFYLSRIPLATYVVFHRSVRLALAEANFANAAMKADSLEYGQGLDTLDDAVRREPASVYTPRIKEADRLRDLAMRKYFTTIKLAAQSGNPEERQAGINLEIVSRPYEKDAKNNYTDQTEQIRGLLRTVGKDEPFAWLQTLKATAIVTDLEAQNNLFDELYRARAEERKNRPAADVDTQEQRKVVDGVYDRIVQRANGASVLNASGVDTGFEPAKLDTFIDKVNAYIDQHKLVEANRGKKHATEEGPEGTEPEA